MSELQGPNSTDISDAEIGFLYANFTLQTILRVQKNGESVELVNIRISQWNVISALIDDLPDAFEAHLPRVRQKDCERSKWFLLSSRDYTIPVRVRWRDQKPDVIRLSMISRVLLNPFEAETKLASIQLQALPKEKLRIFPKSSFYRWRHSGPDFGGIIEGVKAGPSVLCECLVRHIVGGNSLCLRTVEADPGDDSYYLLRLSASAFDLLGIAPGDQVEVSWADRRTFGIALVSQETALKGDISRVERVHTRIEREISDNLTIGVSAPIRAALGIPRRTAVRIRRRAFPLVLRQVNQLTIPVLGLYLAALAISGIRVIFLAAGLFGIVVLLLLSLRYPKPPKGLW
ncbi:MAG TPA: hypothetical protein VGG02_07825 [Chthoniobacterales bacterium]